MLDAAQSSDERQENSGALPRFVQNKRMNDNDKSVASIGKGILFFLALLMVLNVYVIDFFMFSDIQHSSVSKDFPKHCSQQSDKRSPQEIFQASKCIRIINHESVGDPMTVYATVSHKINSDPQVVSEFCLVSSLCRNFASFDLMH